MSDGKPSAGPEKRWIFNGSPIAARSLPAGLHVVATPIGNLEDVTIRALATLAAADVILAEDTRMTRRLLDRYGIHARLRRFDAHAGERDIAQAIDDIAAGKALALVSDAGTPLLSDPGADLVREAVRRGVPVHPVPGPSALLAGLVAAGLPADRFFFEGFLPSKSGDRRRRLRLLEGVPGAIVFYEAPHRLLKTLDDLVAILGDRPAAAARELTKLHEQVVRGPLSAIAAHFAEVEPRGEFVLVVGAPEAAAAAAEDDVGNRLAALMSGMSVKDAAAVAAAEFGLAKREAYARALLLQGRASLSEAEAEGADGAKDG